nr:four-carbon acid sugar kinase family protein [Allomuricauda sp.]
MDNTGIQKSIDSAPDFNLLQEEILQSLKERPRTLVILDDDPTGTQTVHNIPVVTKWSEEILEKEITESRVFFILTNSRSLQRGNANALAKLIGGRLKKVSEKVGKELLVISRSDSTLRGHYPNEVEALEEVLELKNPIHVIAPAFFEGGRYTFGDVHYVKEGNQFIPCGETPFAQDNTFGYTSSNLRDWIVEKYGNRLSEESFASYSVSSLRNNQEGLRQKLESIQTTHLVVNAVSYHDLQQAALICLNTDRPILLRTAASFVNAIGGIVPKDCLKTSEVITKNNTNGALFIVGSYVPKTTEQLNHLKENSNAYFLELDANLVLNDSSFDRHLEGLLENLEHKISEGMDVVMHTSRTVVKGNSKEESLDLVNKVSEGLVTIIKDLKTRPKYIVAKGGITSSDVATKGLKVKKAMVLGQVLKGIPVWRLQHESKFPGLPYIVFPGNVGEKGSLTKLKKQLE